MIGALSILSYRHILERPVRTGLTVLGIALGVSVSVAIRTANVEVLRAFEDSVLAIAGRATLQVSAGDLGLDELVIADLLKHPAVLSATPVLQQGTTVASGPHAGQPLLVVGLDLLEVRDLKGVRIQDPQGAEPEFELLLEPDTVFVGRRLAEDWGLSVGDELAVLAGPSAHRLVVRGIVEPEAAGPSAWGSLAVMDIAAAQAQFGLFGRLDRVDLVTEPGRSVAEVARELQAALPPPLVVRRPAERNEQVERMLRAFQLNLVTLSAVALLVGVLLVYNTVAFAVVQRRTEIGILRALGMPRGAVTALFLTEAAWMGAIGGLAGTALGVVLARGLVVLVSRTVSELYVSVTVGTGGLAELPSGLLGEGVAMGVLVSMLGAMSPSLEASRTLPARALAPGEYEAVQGRRGSALAWTGGAGLVAAGLLALPGPVHGLPLFGYAATFCLLVSLSLLAPALVRGWGTLLRLDRGPFRQRGDGNMLGLIAADQVARAPGRNAVTISALMVGVAIMVGVGIMIQSFRHTVKEWINQTILADLIVAAPSWLQGEESGMLAKRLPLEWREVVAAVPGVAAVDAYRQLSIELAGRPASLVARDLRLHAERSRYLFVSGESRALLRRTVEERGVIVSEVLADALGTAPGETLALMTPSGERRFPVVGVFYDYATDGGKVVMDRSLYREYWQDETATVLAVYLDPEADPAAVRRDVETRVGRQGHLVVIGNADLKREILAIFDRTFTVTYALEVIAVAIALLGIVNTLLTSVLERRRELATLRAVGASQVQLRRLILWEACYLGLLGALLGIVGGLALSVLLIKVINKQSFGWTIQFLLPPGLLLEAVALALVAALVAGYVPARWAARQPVVDGLRYE
ncbi:FtsX-like permease family protein [Nitrospira sp. Kam-Ns4a]